jgi:hypothetical protein
MRRIISYLWPVRLNHIFSPYLLNGTIYGHLFKIKSVFWFSLQILPDTFLILSRTQWDIINLHRSSCKVPVILAIFKWNLIFLERFSKNTQISDFTKNHPVGAELFHADGETGRHYEANSRFSQFCECAQLHLINNLQTLDLLRSSSYITCVSAFSVSPVRNSFRFDTCLGIL